MHKRLSNFCTFPLLAIGGTTEEQQEVTVEVTAEQEPEPAAPEPETPEVKEEEQAEAEQPAPTPAEEQKEEPQLEERKPEAEEQTADITQLKEKLEEESTTVVQEEAPPPAAQSEGTGEDVTKQKEEITAEQEQPPTKDEAEIQPTAAPESTTATTKEGAKEEPAEVKETAAAAEPEEEVKEKPKRPPRNKVRSTVPTEGVDLAMGDGSLEGVEPITFGQQFKMTLEKYANVEALKWKVQEGEGEEARMVWKTATFAEYYKFCIDAAKSLIKVRHDCNCDTIIVIVLCLFMHFNGDMHA